MAHSPLRLNTSKDQAHLGFPSSFPKFVSSFCIPSSIGCITTESLSFPKNIFFTLQGLTTLSLNFSLSSPLPCGATVSIKSHQICLRYFNSLGVCFHSQPLKSHSRYLQIVINLTLQLTLSCYFVQILQRLSAACGFKFKLLSIHGWVPAHLSLQ